MAVNLASKYSAIVDERFTIGTVTNVAFNRDYDWVGVKTLNIYSIETAPMNDYVRSGTSRYGVPGELQDNVQECTLTQERSFTYTIDRGNDVDQMNVKGAARSLSRQLNEVAIPELDTYRLATIAAGGHGVVETLDETNAYKGFLAGQAYLSDRKVPMVGRIAYMTYDFFNLIKLDPSFVKQGDMSQQMLTTGVMGMVDGIPLIPVPSSYLPPNTNFLLTHPVCACAPVKLAEYFIHVNPPGIGGNLVEGRLYYDTFVLDSKKDAIYWSSHT